MKLTAMFDGACSMKRGVAAGAAVLYDENGTEVACDTQFLRGVTTPIAEYTALHLALRLASSWAGSGASLADVTVLGDAELIIRQVDGRYRCEKPHMLVMRDLALLLMSNFASCEVRELPKAGPDNKRRYGNARADALAGWCKDGLPVSSTRILNVPEFGGPVVVETTSERVDVKPGLEGYWVSYWCSESEVTRVGLMEARAVERGELPRILGQDEAIAGSMESQGLQTPLLRPMQ